MQTFPFFVFCFLQDKYMCDAADNETLVILVCIVYSNMLKHCIILSSFSFLKLCRDILDAEAL